MKDKYYRNINTKKNVRINKETLKVFEDCKESVNMKNYNDSLNKTKAFNSN